MKDILSTQTVNLAKVCAYYYYFLGDVKKAERETLRWADENGFPIPDNIRTVILT